MQRQELFLFLLLAAFTSPVFSSVTLNGTRFIYDSGENEITFKADNNGKGPVLLQSWIDDGNPQLTPDKMMTPFVITPPLSRVEADKGQSFRVTYTHSKNLPEDRESVYWINVLEIPPVNKEASNSLNVAFRTRVKLFYRPAALKNQVDNAAAQVTWHSNGNTLELSNSSPFYISISELTVNQDGRKINVPADMLAPGAKQSLDIQKAGGHALSGSENVVMTFINDYGSHRDQSLTYK